VSGIAGLFHRDGRAVDPVELNRIHDAARDRGVDGGRVWIDGCAGFAYQHLRTTPESGGEQPLSDPASGLSMTFDGRLDNRDELIRALDAPELRDSDDAEIALRAFANWREACAARLLGDFAFAVFDRRLRRLYCARDVMGIRPFYYAAVGWAFLFGTELRQVLASGRVSADYDEGTVAECLADELSTLDATFYRYVRRLPPAHWMTIDAHRIAVNRYWRLDPARRLVYRDDREYAEHFRSLFENAVVCRLRCAQPRVAAWLSGGVDSSSVVGMARALAAKRDVPAVETFSMIFPDDPEADERGYIADVVALSNWPAHQRPGEFPDEAAVFDHAAAYRDVPAVPGEYLAADLRKSARERDIHVVLTGAGGEGFSGSLHHYADLLRSGRLVDVARRIVAYAVRPLARRLGWSGGPPKWIPADFAARVDLDARMRGERRSANVPESDWVCASYENARSVLTLEIGERAAALHGLEERHPYFDRRVVEFALAIPEAQRCRGSQTKVVIREAMRDWLPASVYHRRGKADFSAQVVRALEVLGGAAFLDRLTIASLGWIDAEHVRWMYRDMIGRFRIADAAYTRHISALWAVASVELWYRACVAATVPAASVGRLAGA
jgi:asparagine synthase (glutamine-hydrolysing)